MRSFFTFISSRINQMPFGIRLLSVLCVFAPIFAFGFYFRSDSKVPVGLPKVLLIAIGSAVFVYGFLRATWWSRPLVMLYLVVASIEALFQKHATYSFWHYLGMVFGLGVFVWILFLRRDVRDYYAKAHDPVA